MYRVMVVDDEEHVRDALKDELSVDFVVEAFGAAGPALERLRAQRFDALISDVRMPTVTGVTLLQRASEVDPEMLRIFLTGYADEEVRDAALSLGAYKLRKPWGDELHVLLRNALLERAQWNRLRDELHSYVSFDRHHEACAGLTAEEILGHLVESLRAVDGVAEVNVRRISLPADRWREVCSPFLDAGGPTDHLVVGDYVVEIGHRSPPDERRRRIVDLVVRRARDAVRLRALMDEVRDRTNDLDRIREDLLDRERFAVLGAVSTGVIHDIRGPLSVLYSNHDVLMSIVQESGILDGEVKEICEETNTALETIRRIILSVERVAAVPEAQEDVSVHQCAALTVRLLRHRMNRANVAADISGVGDIFVKATTGEVCQILINLMTNAIDVSPPRSRVRLRAECGEGMVRLRVEDEGPGISEDEASGVFEPFRTSKEGGLGIGLTIARSMARRHGGDIKVVSSSRGCGACFELSLQAAEGV